MRLNQIKTTTSGISSSSSTTNNTLYKTYSINACTYSSHLKLVFYFVCLIHKHFFMSAHVLCMARAECILFLLCILFAYLLSLHEYMYICFDSRFGASKSSLSLSLCHFILVDEETFSISLRTSLTMLSLLTHERHQEMERTRTHTQCQFISAAIMYAMYCLLSQQANQPASQPFNFFFILCFTPIARSSFPKTAAIMKTYSKLFYDSTFSIDEAQEKKLE